MQIAVKCAVEIPIARTSIIAIFGLLLGYASYIACGRATLVSLHRQPGSQNLSFHLAHA